MKKIAIHLILIFFLVWPCVVTGAESAATTEKMPDLVLTVPDNEFYKSYLGLTGKAGETFSVEDVDADIIVIELFSMYCPFCQKEAPLVNELYEKMEVVSKSGPVVKIIGLGASNSQFEVDHFRDTYNVPYPLFPDKDMSMYKALTGAGTPGFIGCRLNNGQNATIVLRNSGGFYSSDEFLKELIDKSSL